MPGILSVLDAFNQARQQSQQEGLGQLQQAQGLMGILSTLQQQQQRQAALAKEQEFRGALSAARTPEEQLAVATKFGDPKDIMAHADRRNSVEANKQTALARLTQAAAQNDAMMQFRMGQAKTAEEKAAVEAAHKRFADQIAAERLKYDTGAVVAVPPMPVRPTAPQQGVDFNFGNGLRGTAPTEEAAMGIWNALQARGGQPAPQPAPNAAPVAPAPAAPDNLDASDLMLRQAQAPQTAAPVTPTAPAKPPEYASWPQKLKDQYDSRLATAQAKAEVVGAGKAPDTIVDAIIEGRMQLPSGFALRSPYWQDVIARVSEKDPKFDATRYGARAAARRTFSSGPEARNVTALNTVIGHLGTLDEAATALDNKDLRVFNTVANRLATELGDPRIQNFDTAKQAVAEETMRVFRQVGASEMEARQWGERITASGSPKQLRGVIATLGKLLESRVEAIGQQYERTVNQSGNPARVDDANKSALGRLIDQGQTPSWDDSKERRYQELLRKRNAQ